MAKQVPDEVLHEFVAVAPHRDLKAAVEKRFGGLVDAIAIGFTPDMADGAAPEVVQDLQAIPKRFSGFPASWT
jgi:hypothetical protein